jgi:putative Mg2+ transporter-C (MgtC) family protein
MTGFDTWIHEAVASYGPLAESMVRGGLVGLEREIRGRQAGFRTNMLVCIGSCLVMLVSIHVADSAVPRAGINVTTDPGRIAYGVMTGIGFLGAGAILQKKDSIRGLTTAAALWCVAALGLAAGIGLYSLAALSALVVLFTLWALDLAEDLIPRRRYRRFTIRARWEPGCTKEAIDWFATAGVKVINISLNRTQDLKSVDFEMVVGFIATSTLQRLERRLQEDGRYELIAIESVA